MVKKTSRAARKERQEKRKQEPERKVIDEPIQEASFQELHVDWTLRHAFTRDEPLTREEYENTYVLPSYGAAAYRRTPPYEEYRQLYDKYSEARSKRKLDSDFYNANMS